MDFDRLDDSDASASASAADPFDDAPFTGGKPLHTSASGSAAGHRLSFQSDRKGDVDDYDSDLTESLEDDLAESRPWFTQNPVIYLLDIIFGNISFMSVWRYPAVAFALSIQWARTDLSLLNFAIPHFIVSTVITWPLLVAEIGMSQCVRGCAPRTFGSLGVRCRFAGLSWIPGAFTCILYGTIAAITMVYVMEAPGRYGAYRSEMAMRRTCTNLGEWVPYVQPRMCFPDESRLDAACYGATANCPLWDGNGRCIAVPWGPASDQLLENAVNVVPWLQNDFPLYCGGRHLHNVGSNDAYAVATREAFWSDYGSYFHWRLIFGFLMAYLLAAGISYAGVGIGSIVRIIIGIFATTMLVVTLMCGLKWYSDNPHASASWMVPVMSWDPRSLGRVEVWAHAVTQSLVTFSIALNVVPPFHAKSPTDTHNIVWHSFLVMTMNGIIGTIATWLVYLGYASLSTEYYPTAGVNAVYGAVAFDVRNSAMGNLFTVMQTVFDNSSNLNGDSPRPLFLAILFWTSLFLLAVMTLHRSFDGVLNACFTSSANWSFGIPRWGWLIGLCGMFIAVSIPFWFGACWSMMVTLQHLLINITVPIFALAEVLAIGWLFGWRVRAKHFGHRSFLSQFGLFFVGALIMAIGPAYLWQQAAWKLVLTEASGLFVVATSFMLPPLLTASHDVYGRKHTQSEAFRVVLYGSVEHLRKELNYRTCHASRFWKLNVLWTFWIKYCAPIGLLFALFPFFSRLDATVNFSAYRPFFNEQNDIFYRVERMLPEFTFAMPWAILAPMMAILLFTILLLPVMAYEPMWLEWLIPKDTDDHFWNVRKAVEIFASHVQNSHVPVRINTSYIGTPYHGASTPYVAGTTPQASSTGHGKSVYQILTPTSPGPDDQAEGRRHVSISTPPNHRSVSTKGEETESLGHFYPDSAHQSVLDDRFML